MKEKPLRVSYCAVLAIHNYTRMNWWQEGNKLEYILITLQVREGFFFFYCGCTPSIVHVKSTTQTILNGY
jgi:hypothetical protein